MDYERRIRQIVEATESAQPHGVLITHIPNIRYLCGFTGSAGVLAISISKGRSRARFFTDGRYTEQARAEVQAARVVIGKGAAVDAATRWLSGQSLQSVVIEAQHVSVWEKNRISRQLRGSRIAVKDRIGVVEQIRMVKEQDELRLVRNSVELGARLLDTAMSAIRPGVLETEVAAAIEYAARRH